MKTITLRFVFLLAVFMLFNSLLALAQEDEKTKVRLKVKKNDTVTVDTTLYVKSGADSDELKKLIKEFSGIEDLDLHIFCSDDLHTHTYTMKKGGCDSLKTVAVFVGEDAEIMDIEIDKKEGKYVVVKKKITSEEGEKLEAYAHAKGDHITITKNMHVEVDTLETLSEEGEQQVRVTIKSGDKGGEHVVWVSKDKANDHHVIMKSGEGDEKDLELIHKKGNVVKVLSEEDLEKIGKDEKGNYYVITRKSGLGEDDEIVIKKKDGNVVIMKGDEIHDIKGHNVYIKTYDDKEGSFDIFLDKDEDGTVIVKKSIKVMKKKGEDGEEEIEITIEEGDETKLKEGTKEKKVVKKKKKEAK